MKFSKTYTNKLVSFVDRYFTYDNKEMLREGTSDYFDFWAVERDHEAYVTVKRTKYGIYCSISKNGKSIISEIYKSYSDIENFKKMIKCLS